MSTPRGGSRHGGGEAMFRESKVQRGCGENAGRQQLPQPPQSRERCERAAQASKRRAGTAVTITLSRWEGLGLDLGRGSIRGGASRVVLGSLGPSGSSQTPRPRPCGAGDTRATGAGQESKPSPHLLILIFLNQL